MSADPHKQQVPPLRSGQDDKLCQQLQTQDIRCKGAYSTRTIFPEGHPEFRRLPEWAED
jgi:hypothetical protein